MIEYITFLFWLIFLGINFYILSSDFTRKKIPNIGVILLLLLWIFWAISWVLEYSLWYALWIVINILISFLLFYKNIWSAWDAKYVIALSLFIPAGALIYTLWNIWLITLIYLFLHTIYLYIWKIFLDFTYTKKLWSKIYTDLREKLVTIFIKSNDSPLWVRSILKTLLPLLVWFLIFFTVIRLLRIYLVNSYIEQSSNKGSAWRWAYLIELIQKYDMYVILWAIISLYLIYRFLRGYISITFSYVCHKVHISEDLWKIIALTLCSIGLIWFIIHEYLRDPIFIADSLILIFTFYIFIWLFIKFLLYVHYVTFQLAEIVYKPIDTLHSWEIVDIPFLIKLFWTQKSLGYKQDSGAYAPKPEKYFKNITNPINDETVTELKKIYKTVNKYHATKATSWFEKIEAIKIMKTFAFAPYIFTWFMVSLLYQDTFIVEISLFLYTKLLGL